MTSMVGVAAVLLAWTTLSAQQRVPAATGAPTVATTAAQQGTHVAAVRNPQQLRAVQVLEQRSPGALPHVQFEWDQVSGAREYVLLGKWTGAQSWTMQSREFRVTQANASRWDAQHVTFEAALTQGSHSWKVVAVFGPNDLADYENATTVSFDLR